MKRPFIMIGAGGHARILLETLLAAGGPIVAVASPDPQRYGYHIWDIPIIGNDDWILHYSPHTIDLVNGIGMMPGNNNRCRIYESFKKLGYAFASIIHPSAILAAHSALSEGVQIMAGAVIQTGSSIGENSIVNTRASVDHDCRIARNVHLASGVTVAGGVTIGERTFVGAGSTIIQGIEVGASCTIAAGSVVVEDIPEGATVRGVPARIVSII